MMSDSYLREAASEARKHDPGAFTMADALSGGLIEPKIGKKTTFPESFGVGHEHSKWDFIGGRSGMEQSRKTGDGPNISEPVQDHHFNSHQRSQNVSLNQGTHTTKFHRGFARKNNSDIRSDAPRLQHEAELRNRSEKHEAARREKLSELNNYNKFNLISGEYDGSRMRKAMNGMPDTHAYDAGFVSGTKATYMHPHMHTMFGRDDPGVGDFPQLIGPPPITTLKEFNGSRLPKMVAAQGRHQLAQSHFRFFAPSQSGDQFDERQMNLVREGGGASHPAAAGGGNGKPRNLKSGIIGTYRYVDVLPSHGVEDQFSKSVYGKDPCEYSDFNKTKQQEAQYFGLVETRRPGLYTPRKQAFRMEEMARRTKGGANMVSSARSSRQGTGRASSAPVSQRDIEIAMVKQLQ